MEIDESCAAALRAFAQLEDDVADLPRPIDVGVAHAGEMLRCDPPHQRQLPLEGVGVDIADLGEGHRGARPEIDRPVDLLVAPLAEQPIEWKRLQRAASLSVGAAGYTDQEENGPRRGVRESSYIGSSS